MGTQAENRARGFLRQLVTRAKSARISHGSLGRSLTFGYLVRFRRAVRQIPSYANRTKSRILMEIEDCVAAWGIVLTSYMGAAWSLCRIICGDRPNTMGDESAKRAAQEYLAGKLSAEGPRHEDKLNREAAEKLGPAVWKTVADTVLAQCREWNGIANEQTFTCRETML
jgi:hypothetical protein